MAAKFKGKMPVAILGHRGHQVQNHLNGLKGHGFGNNVQKLGHCTPKIGEMTAFSIQQVKHHFVDFVTFELFLCFSKLYGKCWHFVNIWSPAAIFLDNSAKIEPFDL